MEVNRTASRVAFFTFEKGISKTEYLFSVNLLHLRIGLQHLSDHIGVAHKTLGYWVIQHLKVENCDISFSQQASISPGARCLDCSSVLFAFFVAAP